MKKKINIPVITTALFLAAALFSSSDNSGFKSDHISFPENSSSDKTADYKSVPETEKVNTDACIRRPPFCGVWGIWGGEKVATEGRPWFKGVVTTTTWDEIEPENGQFSWESFDSKVRNITGKGLYVMILVYHSLRSPRWIYEAGVPKVHIVNGNSTIIHPYYFDPDYKPLLSRMINETAKHLSDYPPELRKYIIGVQCPTGKSGDPQPYMEGVPEEKEYAIDRQGKEWVNWTIDMIKVYRDAYKVFDPPFFLLFKGPNPATNDWLLKNIPDSWRKPHAMAQGYQFNSEIRVMNELYPLTARYHNGVVIRTRGELDRTDAKEKNWFTSAPVWNVYWSGLWNLTYGLDIWSQLTGALEDERHVPAFTFFSQYAGYKDPADSPGAWVALHDGLDCLDTIRFPEDRFGPVGPVNGGRPSQNKDRYRRIAEKFKPFGASLDDPENVALDHLNTRDQKGINDVYCDIWTGNYGMFLEQIKPRETSQGYWRVGSMQEPYGRFARGFDLKNNKTAMYFDLENGFFLNKKTSHSISLRVVYFDKGNGTWSLKYDAADNPAKVAGTVRNTNTGHWKEITVNLDDARLQGRGPENSDITLTYNGGDETIFHMVELRRR